ncbi:ankyrin repeat domain-containing protein 12 isoform X2 [Alosa sapidissima]|uniref:ankyrin repeat domain-containing protein 12 isoform X2 n=1 Tax=Alosa sapidissima TaxID=34773 RepID=UPI001C09C7C9|nr:ankyrin repeat domain-containing protein 12 isoform X2 [Alosa sapidissima]
MAKPGSDRDGAMVEKQAGKKSKDKISPFTKTPKLDRSEFLGKEAKSKSSMKRKLSFTVSPPRNQEKDSDTDDSDHGQSSEVWGDSLAPPCRIHAEKDGPDKKKVKKEAAGKKSSSSSSSSSSTPVNILFGYPLSERKQMALLMQMTARDNSPDSTPSHPSQTPPVQKKHTGSSSTSRQKDKVNKRNERGETPLHMAAIRGDVAQVRQLISLGADVNVKDFAGWTPLHEACNLGYYDVAKVLISAGAEVNTQGLDDDTPLHDASSSGHKDIVKLLLRNGGNAFQANKRGERPVDVADSQELEQLLKGEVQLSDPEDSSSDSEDPPSVNPSSVDDNMDDSDGDKDSDSKHASGMTAKASSSVSGLDEYEFKDEEEEEDLSKALNDRHILRRELRQKEKEEKERNHYASKQASKSETPNASTKPKKSKASRVIYCTSDSSSDEGDAPAERKGSPTRSGCVDGHKAESRSKKDSQGGISISDQKDKGKVKKKSKSQSKNKENQEVREDGKENSKALLFSPSTTSENSDKVTREEDSFKMSFSPKDDSSVHLFHLSAVKSPKLNHSLSDKQPTTPLKQENSKTCVPIVGDGPCQVDGIKYNHCTDGEYCLESSSSKGCKHKEKSKHHQKDLGLEGDDRSSSPFKDGSLGNSVDGADIALRKTDKDGKVVKKHKLKHKEKEKDKEKSRKEYEADKNRHRPKEKDGRKDAQRNMEFDREFWKENFFKSDENEELMSMGKNADSSLGNSLQKASGGSPVKEERGTTKDKYSSSSSSSTSSSGSNKDRRPKEEREKDKSVKREKKDTTCKEEREKEGRDKEIEDCVPDVVGSVRVPEESQHSVKEEVEDKHVTDPEHQDPSEKSSREKGDKKLPSKDREGEKSEKKHTDKEKKIKTEHFSDKYELQNSTDKWKEREKTSGSTSHSPGDKNKESEKLKSLSAAKKHEENRKSKDKPDRKAEKDRSEKEHAAGEHREREKISSDRKGRVPDKTTDHNKMDRTKEKDKEKEKDKDRDRKKEKSKENSSSSSSNLKLLLEDKKGYVSESSKTAQSKVKEDVPRTPEKDRDRRERERDSDRHRDRERHKDKDRSLQQGKVVKPKPSEPEADRTKSKASPSSRDVRPKEKRLVNDDLMQTSFERMLSLKDQEIEQWHRKHLEKIKQKERERMKQRPGSDLSKQKSNKDKSKTPSSSSTGDTCPGKELLRSKSSEASEPHSRDKPLRDATSGRTVSLDSKNLSAFGKLGPALENSLSRSPRPESERSGHMSRSVSMVSVASSEDSCHATILTPRPAEYDSDLNLEASDSQPPFLQSSLNLQSSRSPVVHEKDINSLPEAQSNRTPLLSRNVSPYLKAILDEDARPAPTEGRTFEETQRTGSSHSSDEKSRAMLPETSSVQVQDNQSQSAQSHPSSTAETESLNNPEAEGSVTGPHLIQGPNSRDPGCSQQSSLSQGSCTLAVPVDHQKPSLSESLSGSDVQCPPQENPSGPDTIESPNKDSRDLSVTLVSRVSMSPLPSPQQHSTNTKASSHSVSQQDATIDTIIDPSLRPDGPLPTSVEPQDRSIAETADVRLEEKESTLGGSRMEWMSSPATPLSTLKSSPDTKRNAETKDAAQAMDATDPAATRPQTETLSSSDAQIQKTEHVSLSSSLQKAESLCPSPAHDPEEPMEVTTEAPDGSSGVEMLAEKASTSWETTTQFPSTSETKPEVAEEKNDQPAAEDQPPLESRPIVPLNEGEKGPISGATSQSDGSTEMGLLEGTSGGSSPLSVTTSERDTDSSGAKAKARPLEDEVDIQVHHPRKRKMPRVSPSTQPVLTAQQMKERTQQSLAAIVDSLKLEEIQPYQTERANPYYEFLHIRKKIEEKRKVLCSVIPQAPQYYDEYVTFNGSYLIHGNPLSKLCIPTITPPPSLPEPLKEMFKQQEVVRMKLRLQHSIEREKLIVSNEQEVLRVHYRAARTLANQTLPFSACTVLLDAEVYNMPQEVQGEDGKTSVRDRFNARQFMSWLQDVDDKFDKLKTCLLMRQQHEAAALNAVQRLEWQLKLQELDPATYKSTSIFEISEFYIPLVEVNDDFDLTPI